MMVGAQGSLVLELSGQPCFGGSTGRSLGSRDDLDAALTENRGGMNAHSARNDDLRAKVGDKVRQKAGLVSGIRNGLLLSAVKKAKLWQWPKWPVTAEPSQATAMIIKLRSFLFYVACEYSHVWGMCGKRRS